MNFKNKYLLITLRTLFGLALIAIGVMGLFMDPPTEGMSEAGAAALAGIEALGLVQLIAVVEIIAGLFIVTGFLPAFGALLSAPIIVVMVAFHAVKEPSTIVPSLVFALLNAYMGYAYWDKYKAIFKR
jgi:putative oxidoreductase